MKYVPAEFGKNGFNCPYHGCDAFSKQNWNNVSWIRNGQYASVPSIMLAVCDHCGRFSVWLDKELVHPTIMGAPTPHPDMPPDIEKDYEEARAVLGKSPRSSAALLRLAIQKICIHQGLPGKNLNEDIGALVSQGLPVRIQQSLDIVRVVGNEQVHPGMLDVRDDPKVARLLFELVNLIVEDRIGNPKRVAELYAKLPQQKREAIEKRDAPKTQA